jgi:hypothetical protein
VPDACVAVRYASRGSEAAPETESVDSVESKLLVIFYALTRTVLYVYTKTCSTLLVVQYVCVCYFKSP